MIEFSCLLSCYFKESPSYLSQSLESILAQTLLPNEIVIVEDGELTDELYAVLDLYERKLPIKRFALKENKGLGYALNYGLKCVEHDLVFRMDTDDVCLSDRFEKQINFHIENPEVDIFGGWAIDFDENGVLGKERKCVVNHKEIYNTIWACPLIHPTVVFKKHKILSIGSYSQDIPRRQDYELWMKAAQCGLIFANMSEFLIYYRFTDSYYKKNSFRNSLLQTKIAFKGIRKLDTPIKAYFFVLMPLLRSLLPVWLNKKISLVVARFDPRKYKTK